jgi:hypothetical protein
MDSQKRHQRTFSEDDRIQAQENVKKVEEEDAGEISEPEDPLLLSRDAKDWKVSSLAIKPEPYLTFYLFVAGPRSLRRPWALEIPIQSH